jgi:hypothetical protein
MRVFPARYAISWMVLIVAGIHIERRRGAILSPGTDDGRRAALGILVDHLVQPGSKIVIRGRMGRAVTAGQVIPTAQMGDSR